MNTCPSCGAILSGNVCTNCQIITGTSGNNGTLNISNGYTCPSCGQYTYHGVLHICNGTAGYVQNQQPYNTTFIFPPNVKLEDLFNIQGLAEEGTCSRCKENKHLVISYRVIKVPRKLCEECVAAVADKIFDVESNPKMETALYGKS